MYMSVGLGAAPLPRSRAMRLPNGKVAIHLPRVLVRGPRGIGALGCPPGMSAQACGNYDAWVAGGGGGATNPGVNPNGPLLVRPGPNGGSEIVDPLGNVVYTEGQVSANPSLLNQLSGVCPAGMLPTFEPGGESLCAGSATTPEGTVIGPQFNYPVNGVCPVAGWCFTGSNPNDPNSYSWIGGGNPTSLNPAYILNAPSLPGVYVGTDPLPPTILPAPAPSEPMIPVNQPNRLAGQRLPRLRRWLQATATLKNVSRPGQSFQVGDAWSLVITGSPNQPVSGSAVQDGNSLGTSPYGSTDGSGQLTLTGTFDSTTIGTWREMWTVGTSAAPVLNFTVAAGASSTAPSSSPASTAPQSTTSPATTSAGFDFSFLTSPVNLMGVSVPAWGIGAAAIAALFLLGGSRR